MDRKRNLILVTHYYPPLNEVASLRLFSFAKYLSDDFNVMVITSRKYPTDGKSNLNLTAERVTVHEIDYLSGFLRLPFIQRILARFNVVQLRFAGLLDSRLLWARKAAAFVSNKIPLKENDIILASYGPVASFYAGKLIKDKNPHVHLVMDYRDLWSGNPYLKILFPFNIIQRSLERKLLSRASLITTVSEGLCSELRKIFDATAHLIPNGYFPEELAAPGRRVKNERFTFVYSGFLYKGKRDPEPLFRSLRNLLDQNFFQESQIVVRFYASHEGLLRSLIEKYSLDRVVEIYDKVGRAEILQIQRNADCLLFFEWNDPKAKGVLTGKLFEYLVSGSRILSIGPSEDAESSQLILESCSGYCCGIDVDKIDAAIKQMIVAPVEHQIDLNVIEKYNRQSIAQRLGKLMSALQKPN